MALTICNTMSLWSPFKKWSML